MKCMLSANANQCGQCKEKQQQPTNDSKQSVYECMKNEQQKKKNRTDTIETIFIFYILFQRLNEEPYILCGFWLRSVLR